MMPLSANVTLCAFLLALQASPSLAGEQKYSLKGDHAPIGSHLRRDVAWSSVPFDKSYDQLSEEHKAIVRARYEFMELGDEPPYPAKGQASLFRALREAAGILQSEGDLYLGVMVGPDGKGVSVNVYKTPHPDLATFGAAMLMKQQFKPALCKGKPCAQEYPLQIQFIPEQ